MIRPSPDLKSYLRMGRKDVRLGSSSIVASGAWNTAEHKTA